jgi:hypothetical protein
MKDRMVLIGGQIRQDFGHEGEIKTPVQDKGTDRLLKKKVRLLRVGAIPNRHLPEGGELRRGGGYILFA